MWITQADMPAVALLHGCALIHSPSPVNSALINKKQESLMISGQ